MSAAKHTPGPWVAGWNGGLTGPTCPQQAPTVAGKIWGFLPVAKGDKTIAICPNQAVGQEQIEGSAEANARLIAAAPDMLEALREAEGELYQVPPADAEQERVLAIVRAAIAKAEGRS